jgi:hypothetical protein
MAMKAWLYIPLILEVTCSKANSADKRLEPTVARVWYHLPYGLPTEAAHRLGVCSPAKATRPPRRCLSSWSRLRLLRAGILRWQLGLNQTA